MTNILFKVGRSHDSGILLKRYFLGKDVRWPVC